MKKSLGHLYLIPTLLGGEDIVRCVPMLNVEIIKEISHFVVEELRTARRFLKKTDSSFPIDDCFFELLNEHTDISGIETMLLPALEGKNIGLLSEAGIPCIADPGSALVFAAHKKQIPVVPLVGASSIFMALMASGLMGQSFIFHGYLPTDKQQLANKIKLLEQSSAKNNQSQLFIEAPYRNNQLFQQLLNHCHPETYLCIAANITLPTEYIATKSVKEWKKQTLPDLHKQPSVFILQTGNLL